jgi:CheY-like chemotaxis protein/HPt (histidine-containing phosphotransfer) domain-containing protein/anti-sigma regulatory factor (Ser/Thr protein kinase)
VELTERVVDLISIEASNKGLEVVTDIDYSIGNVSGDSNRVQQILLNLLKNAVKFTEKGFILVRVSQKRGKLIFEIIDSGIGVPEDKKDLIFTKFYQVDRSSVRASGGTGLGLAICKSLVSAMKGRIGILSNPSGGSNFWFSIPLEKSEYEKPEQFSAKIPSDAKALVIDDDNFSLKSVKRKLNYFSVRNVDLACDGKSAIDRIKKAAESGKKYDLILVDLSILESNRFDFLPGIAPVYDKNDKSLFLMIPEGQLNKNSNMQLLNLFQEYIYKPVKKSQLWSVLKKVYAVQDDFSVEGTAEPKDARNRNISAIMNEQVASGVNVLVAEDTNVNKILLGTFLQKFGATVFYAEDGQIAVERVKEHPEIDVIFMDIFMPVKSGIDATIELRKKGYKGVIIACTANNDADDFRMYKKIGINDIIIKPFRRSQVKDVLQKWYSVLAFPNGKEMITLTYVERMSSGIWDVKDFMDTAGNDKEFAVSLMDEYMAQTEKVMKNLKEELVKEKKDFSKIELYTHTLKGSSASVSATRFAELGKRMNDAAKERNIIELESARINFELDFLTFKNLIGNWKTTI